MPTTVSCLSPANCNLTSHYPEQQPACGCAETADELKKYQESLMSKMSTRLTGYCVFTTSFIGLTDTLLSPGGHVISMGVGAAQLVAGAIMFMHASFQDVDINAQLGGNTQWFVPVSRALAMWLVAQGSARLVNRTTATVNTVATPGSQPLMS